MFVPMTDLTQPGSAGLMAFFPEAVTVLKGKTADGNEVVLLECVNGDYAFSIALGTSERAKKILSALLVDVDI